MMYEKKNSVYLSTTELKFSAPLYQRDTRQRRETWNTSCGIMTDVPLTQVIE